MALPYKIGMIEGYLIKSNLFDIFSLLNGEINKFEKVQKSSTMYVILSIGYM